MLSPEMLPDIGKQVKNANERRKMRTGGVLTPEQIKKAVETPETADEALADIMKMEKGRAAEEGIVFGVKKPKLEAVPKHDEEWEQITKEREEGSEARMKKYKEEAKAAVKKGKELKDQRAVEQFGGKLPKSKKVKGEAVVIYDNPPEELRQGYEEPSVIIEDAATLNAMEQSDVETAEMVAAEKERIFEDLKKRDNEGETGLDDQLDAAAQEMSDAQIALMEARERAAVWTKDKAEIERLEAEIQGDVKAEGDAAAALKQEESKKEAGIIWGAAKKLDQEAAEKVEQAWYEAGEAPEDALKSELTIVTANSEKLQKEWRDLEVQLEKIGVDPDRPVGLLGRLGFGLKKVFNPNLRKLHSGYVAKVKAWNETMDRAQEIRAALNVNEGPGATVSHKRKRRDRGGKPPTASTSIRGENQ